MNDYKARRDILALDDELFGIVEQYGPATIERLFEGLRPKWAEAAAERLVIAGKLREDAEGRLALV